MNYPVSDRWDWYIWGSCLRSSRSN